MNKKWTQSAFWKNYGATIICFVLALCILGVGLILRGAWTEQIVKIKESKMEIVTKKQLEENKEAQTSKVVSQSMLKAVSDVDFSGRAMRHIEIPGMRSKKSILILKNRLIF